jgi:hypothetical protein
MTEVQQDQRNERLSAALARVRARGGIPIERWLAIAGALLVAVGIPFIILGWYGAAHTPYTFEQIPYMISGGLLGLALTILGGLFYFAFWMTRQVQETHRTAEQTQQVFRRLEELAASNGHAPGAITAVAGTFVTTSKGNMFHRPDCVVVKDRTDVRRVTGTEEGLKPCKICDPLGEEAETAR